jgi:hypothetical protein
MNEGLRKDEAISGLRKAISAILARHQISSYIQYPVAGGPTPP